MSGAQHLSMRIPWRDRPWDDRVCDHPLDNSSCLLLKNIGDKRDDDYEREVAGRPLAQVDADRIPCLSERATFMSPDGYRVTKKHPYAQNGTLKGHLFPTDVVMPGHAFEAVPFRWLSRESFTAQIWDEWHADYDPGAEDRIDQLLGFSPTWIMDGANQRSVIQQFFEPVVPGQSLVFVYLKHSPLQDESTRRLLVGAARVTDVQLPSMWKQSGNEPFSSSMWETALVHSLRPDMKDGVLLPYQQLVGLLDEGADVSAALAWAPEDRDLEFSYVTEHVSDDTAIDALHSLRNAADAMRELGLQIPASAMTWLDDQIEQLWQLRGPTPGLGAVLSYLGVEGGHRVARTLLGELAPGSSPWPTLEERFADPGRLPTSIVADVVPSVGQLWGALEDAERRALRVLSAMEVSTDQVRMLMEGYTTHPLLPEELVDNPYYAAICTYRNPLHVGFATVDRACFPAPHVSWPSIAAEECGLTDSRDARRVEALVVDVLERCAEEGDTVVSQADAVERANSYLLTRRCEVSTTLLKAYDLDAESLLEADAWSPMIGTTLGDGSPALKLLHLAEVRESIREVLTARRQARRFAADFDARAEIDVALPKVDQVTEEEELARTEKSAGLRELYSSRLSVLVGPAGTGKTSLLKALADLDGVRDSGILLLAPTGKARVQLQSKVGHPAQTLASFLVKKGGFDPDTGRYLEVPPAHRVDAGLVVIDEASMLTEEMLAAALSALRQVERLVLVGDPRQLPPIGAGRPFVDTVEWLRPDSFDGDVRVAPGYVELTVFRRQGGRDRHDLALAAWFGGGDLPAGADEIWQLLRSGAPLPTLEHVPWTDGDVIKSLMGVLTKELDLSSSDDVAKAFKVTYGGTLTSDGRYLNWHIGADGAGASCEKWQILSPTRSRVFGTIELNRHIKRTYRGTDLTLAKRWSGWRNPRPIGPEQIVRGDKVMQTRNNSNAKAYPAGAGLDYVANGEIGVVTGRWNNTGKPPAQVEFSSQLGATYTYWPSSSEDPWLELAWAVTVHKSQGSEFGTTILVLPQRARMSRELLYTALTRQTKKIVILHDGTVDDLAALARPSESETARRLTDLFRPAQPRQVTVGDTARRFDGNLIHVAANDVMVRSKNEVIIADILESVAPGRWRYEVQITGGDGTSKLPDFTIDTLSGERIYWEHLGMMNNPRYAHDWDLKKQWYAENGIFAFDHPDAPGTNGTLMWTDDREGVDRPEWLRLAEHVIGPASPSGAPRRTAAKKASRRR